MAGHSPALQRATAALVAYTDERWVEVAEGVLDQVMQGHRGSHPVQARAGRGIYHVSEKVLTQALQRALDPLPHCEVTAMRVHTDRNIYTGVTLVVTVEYHHSIIAMADRIRDIAQRCLQGILGPVPIPVTVTGMHVHVADVIANDPKRG